jgi:hypothetical protein
MTFVMVNGDVLSGTDYIIEFYFDEVRFQKVET